jgi:hypothetical protein
MVYRGRVERGNIVLESGQELPEGAEVRVELVTREETAADPLLRMPDLAVETGIPDLATNIDRYLYDHPILPTRHPAGSLSDPKDLGGG